MTIDMDMPFGEFARKHLDAGAGSNAAVDRLVIPAVPSNLKVGDYVFACRWSDADWSDPWAVGYVREVGENYIVLGEEDGSPISGVGARCFKKATLVTKKQGVRIIAEYPRREGSDFDPSIIAQILSEV